MNTSKQFATLRILVILLAALAMPFLLRAQTATVSGTVTDPTGAYVSDAAVTATNLATAAERTTASTSTGFHPLPMLQLFHSSASGYIASPNLS